jgi:hypothetical protein
MQVRIFIIAAALAAGGMFNASVVPAHGATAIVSTPLGGPPRVSLLGRMEGKLTRAQLKQARRVEVVGCVTEVRILSVTVRYALGKGKPTQLVAKGAELSEAQRQAMIALPEGTRFTVVVQAVSDGRALEVPEAAFIVGV